MPRLVQVRVGVAACGGAACVMLEHKRIPPPHATSNSRALWAVSTSLLSVCSGCQSAKMLPAQFCCAPQSRPKMSPRPTLMASALTDCGGLMAVVCWLLLLLLIAGLTWAAARQSGLPSRVQPLCCGHTSTGHPACRAPSQGMVVPCPGDWWHLPYGIVVPCLGGCCHCTSDSTPQPAVDRVGFQTKLLTRSGWTSAASYCMAWCGYIPFAGPLGLVYGRAGLWQRCGLPAALQMASVVRI